MGQAMKLLSFLQVERLQPTMEGGDWLFVADRMSAGVVCVEGRGCMIV